MNLPFTETTEARLQLADQRAADALLVACVSRTSRFTKAEAIERRKATTHALMEFQLRQGREE